MNPTPSAATWSSALGAGFGCDFGGGGAAFVVSRCGAADAVVSSDGGETSWRSWRRAKNNHAARSVTAPSASAATFRLNDELLPDNSVARSTSSLRDRPHHRLGRILPGVAVAVPARRRVGLAGRILVTDQVVGGVVVRRRRDRV